MKISELQERAHKNAANKGFWDMERGILGKMHHYGDFTTKEIIAVYDAFCCQRLMLMVSELGEAIEALRKDNFDGYKEELADTVIRILDECGGSKINLEAEILRKMAVNEKRSHRHGKEF